LRRASYDGAHNVRGRGRDVAKAGQLCLRGFGLCGSPCLPGFLLGQGLLGKLAVGFVASGASLSDAIERGIGVGHWSISLSE